MFRILQTDSPSWQETMLSAPQEAFRQSFKNNDDNASLLMALHCPSMFTNETCNCTDDSYTQLLFKILRWVKLIALKLAASYYALPIVLALLPLMLGICIGYTLGLKRQNSQKKDTQSSRILLATQYARRFILGILFALSGRSTTKDGSAMIENVKDSASKKTNTTENVKVTVETHPNNLNQLLRETDEEMRERENRARQDLQSDRDTLSESGVEPDQVPKHVAIIMDGNRRYGKQVYGNSTSGHWEGSQKVLQVAKWCIAEKIDVLTVFAFSTENWRRDPTEVASLMAIFTRYCEELRVEAIKRNIRVRILSTDVTQLPTHVKVAFDKLQNDTEHCAGGLEMNICLSYGGRGEIVNACRHLADECANRLRQANTISEADIRSALLTKHTSDPDILIRTSGEERISNFLLWQMAYTEFFFLDCHWPEFTKDDLIRVIQSYARGRQRRFGR